MRTRAFLVALAVPCSLLAQSTLPDPPNTAAPAASGPQSPQWKALSVEDKLRYDGQHLFELDNMIYAGIGAAFDQGRDRPGAWGQGWGAYSERYASHVGQYLIQRSIMFPVQALDGEDTRFFRSQHTNLYARVGDAFLHTIWRHNDSGGMMPAYSEFLGDYGAAAVSRMWWPPGYRNGRSILLAGSDTVLIDAGINAVREFAPDVKRWLHLGH